MVRIYKSQNVYDAALERIRYLFDEFEDVSVSYSGGKDSTVILELSLIVAKEKGRLPLKVMFIDQEAEWTYTIDEVRRVMNLKEVDPYWYQIPFKIENATSFDTPYLSIWEKGKEKDWIRPKEDIAIKENNYNCDVWGAGKTGIFTAIFLKDFSSKKHCSIGGVRSEETPRRYLALTNDLTYKDITWGNKHCGTNNYVFYPIYDWSYTDVWKAIHDNNWSYNKVYDYQYRYGIKIPDMRVSNLHHETAIICLFYLQEIDNEVYNKLTTRLRGVDMAGKMGAEDYFVTKLPFVFKDWQEYRDFLIEKLVMDEKFKKKISRFINTYEELFKDNPKKQKQYTKTVISTILVNDTAGTKIKNAKYDFAMWRDKRRK